MSSGAPSEFWPLWLADDLSEWGVWTFEYDSAPTLWRGHSMARVDRATNLLTHLLGESRLSTGSIAFVAHSFGGLVVEQMIRSASERSNSEPDVKRLLGQIEKITFLGTPHRGADLATWGGQLGLVFRPSAAAEGLVRNDPDLRDLNYFYRRYSQEPGIHPQSITENPPPPFFGLVVKPESTVIALPSPPSRPELSVAQPVS